MITAETRESLKATQLAHAYEIEAESLLIALVAPLKRAVERGAELAGKPVDPVAATDAAFVAHVGEMAPMLQQLAGLWADWSANHWRLLGLTDPDAPVEPVEPEPETPFE